MTRAGAPVLAELSPVTDFREACCRFASLASQCVPLVPDAPRSQYEQSECTRGGYCNFMHIKPVSRELKFGHCMIACHRSSPVGPRLPIGAPATVASSGSAIVATETNASASAAPAGTHVPLTSWQYLICIQGWQWTAILGMLDAATPSFRFMSECKRKMGNHNKFSEAKVTVTTVRGDRVFGQARTRMLPAGHEVAILLIHAQVVDGRQSRKGSHVSIAAANAHHCGPDLCAEKVRSGTRDVLECACNACSICASDACTPWHVSPMPVDRCQIKSFLFCTLRHGSSPDIAHTDLTLQREAQQQHATPAARQAPVAQAAARRVGPASVAGARVAGGRT